MRKNKFYKVALANASGVELSAAELEAQIEKVIVMAGSEKAAAVGALTAENRDIWTEVNSSHSRHVVLCLTSCRPVTLSSQPLLRTRLPLRKSNLPSWSFA